MKKARDDFAMGITIDCVEVFIRDAWDKLGQITGDNIPEDIIDKIFQDFCIGK